MQKSFFYQRSFRSYLIPVLLLICSFVIYSYSLENQPKYSDETLYLAWGGPYFQIIKEGDFNNQCLEGLVDCEYLYDTNWEGDNVNYTPVRNFFVGFGYFLTTGDTKGSFYEWSCVYGRPCWDPEKAPTSEEFVSGRFFSPIFGSLSIVLAFFIGKILFNRTTGLFFSLILLFSSLWFVNSRLIMSEVYLYFFILLSIFLLLKSFKKESKYRIAYLISGAISFGFALNIKLVAIEFVIPILVMILFYNSFNEKLNFRFFKNKKNVVKVLSLVLVFLVVSSIAFVAIFPRDFDDTFNQISKISSDTEVKGDYVSLPTAEKNYLFRTLAILQVTLFPYLMDSYIDEAFPDVFPNGIEQFKNFWRINDISPSNYSTIPLSLFFFIGLIYLIQKIKTRSLSFSELALLVWFASVFIFTILIVDFPWMERYYLPTMFSIILIASYGLGRFIKEIQNQKEKILFFSSFIIAQALYIIPFIEEIYYSSYSRILSPWSQQMPIHSQLALNDPLVFISTFTFIMIFVLIYLRIKTRIPVETRQARS